MIDNHRVVSDGTGRRDTGTGLEIEPALSMPEQTQKIERETDELSEMDDAGDVDSEQTLEILRRAATLDLIEENTLPEF